MNECEAIEQVEPLKLTEREHFLMLWKRYSAKIVAVNANAVRLDYLVGRAAFVDGCSRREVALMLAVGTEMVRQIREQQGRKLATDYVNKTVASVCRVQQDLKMDLRKFQRRSVEMGD